MWLSKKRKRSFAQQESSSSSSSSSSFLLVGDNLVFLFSFLNQDVHESKLQDGQADQKVDPALALRCDDRVRGGFWQDHIS